MTKIIYFNQAALAVLAMILLSFFFRRVTKGLSNKSFLLAITEVLVTTLFGVFSIYFDNLGAGHVAEKWAFHAGYLFFHTLTSAFYLGYLISLTDTWHKLKKKVWLALLSGLPALLMMIMMLINCFTPIVFYINDADVYTRGPAFVITYAVGAFYLVYGIVYVFYHKKLFSVKWILTLFTPYPLILISILIEFFYPHIVIELFVNALALLFVSNYVQTPAELMDPLTGLGNASSYEAKCRKAFINNKPLMEILVKICNYSVLRVAMSFDERAQMKEYITNQINVVLKEKKLSALVYYTNNGCFNVLVNEKSFSRVPLCAKLINDRLRVNLFKDTSVAPVTGVCVVRIPNDISDYDTLVNFNQHFGSREVSDRVLFADELFKDNYYKVILNIDRIIENAIAKNRLEVYYQPIYSTEKKRFTCAEALLRLKDETFGFVSPDLFIPAAERSGAIHKIGDFVLNEVCAFLSTAEFAELGVDYIEVNLSVAQCTRTDLTAQVCETLERHGVTNEKINLEITETAVSQSHHLLLDNLKRLQEHGIGISLDDFGSGYSNIKRISSLPVSIVKLDKSFISDSDSSRASLILSKTVDMLKSIDMEIVVEGVEDEETANRFIDMGCQFIQGYFYARPMTKENYIAFVKGEIAAKN